MNSGSATVGGRGRPRFGCFGSTRQARIEAMARLVLADGAGPDELLLALTSASPADPAFRAIGDAIERDTACAGENEEREP